MEDNKRDIPYIVFESEMARSERHTKRMWIALLVMALLLIASFVTIILQHKYYLDYLAQYDFESTTEEYQLSTDGGGNANYIGRDGDINNGTSNSTQDNTEENS